MAIVLRKFPWSSLVSGIGTSVKDSLSILPLKGNDTWQALSFIDVRESIPTSKVSSVVERRRRMIDAVADGVQQELLRVRASPVHSPRQRDRHVGAARASPVAGADQPQPSSFIAQPAFQIFVMWWILSPANSITYT